MGIYCTLLLLIICSYYDIRYQKVPIVWIALFSVLGAAGILLFHPEEWYQILINSIIGIVLLLGSKISHEQIGIGDGYMLITTGILLGVWQNFILLAGAMFLMFFYAIGILIFHKGNKTTTIPFAPFLSASCIGIIVVNYF